MKVHCDPNRRHDFVYLFDVVNGNPNGDPDAGNLPRFDPETSLGLVTDVCIKRKVRDYVAGVLGKEIFIQSQLALNTLVAESRNNARRADGSPIGQPLEVNLGENAKLRQLLDDEGSRLAEHLDNLEDFDFDPERKVLTYNGDAKNKKEFSTALKPEDDDYEDPEKALDIIAGLLVTAAKGRKALSAQDRAIVKFDLCRRYYDIRMFGAVLTAGTNFGQVRGPMQLTFARSIDPVHPLDISITRVAITKPSDQLRKTTEMGRKAIVPYGLYRQHGFYNPLLARGKNAQGETVQLVGEQDLQDFWDALCNLFTFDRSAARGEMSCRGLFVFTHDTERGNAPAHKLFDLVRVEPLGDNPRSFDQYRDRIQAPPDGAVSGFEGVTVTRLV